MNTKSFVFATLTLFGAASAWADHDNPLHYQASELARTSDAMLCSYERSLSNCHMDSRQRAFLASLRCMQTMSNRLHNQIDTGAETCILSETMRGLQNGFGITSSQAAGVCLPANTRSLFSQYGDVFRRVKVTIACQSERRHESAERFDDRFDNRSDRRQSQRYEEPRRGSGSERDVLIGALSRLLGSR